MVTILYYPVEPFEWQTEKDIEYKVIYNIEETDLELKFTFNCNFFGNNKVLSCSFNKNESKGKCYQVNFYRFDTDGELLITEAFKSLSSDDFSKSGSSSSVKGLLKLVIDPEGDIVVFLVQRYKAIDGFDCIEVDTKTKSIIGYLCEHNSWFANYFQLYRKKGEFLKQVDVYNSVSYLEAQVDVLTRALLELLPDGNSYKEVLRKADSYSVLNIKPIEDIDKEFTESKKKFRDNQEGYYFELHGENDSN